MSPQKAGRMKYLIATFLPPIVVMYLISALLQHGLLPGGRTVAQVYNSLFLLSIIVLGYLLIFRKNHLIKVEDNKVIETNYLNKELCRLTVSQIHTYRRNLFGEIILLDKNGNKLLCIETNMSNFDLFLQWLNRHAIYQNKE